MLGSSIDTCSRVSLGNFTHFHMKVKQEVNLDSTSDNVNDVHVGALYEAFNINFRLPEKFMKVLTKMVSVAQHDDQSKHQDHDGANFCIQTLVHTWNFHPDTDAPLRVSTLTVLHEGSSLFFSAVRAAMI